MYSVQGNLRHGQTATHPSPSRKKANTGKYVGLQCLLRTGYVWQWPIKPSLTSVNSRSSPPSSLRNLLRPLHCPALPFAVCYSFSVLNLHHNYTIKLARRTATPARVLPSLNADLISSGGPAIRLTRLQRTGHANVRRPGFFYNQKKMHTLRSNNSQENQ